MPSLWMVFGVAGLAACAALASARAADDTGLTFFDPGNPDADAVAAPDGPVAVGWERDRELVKIDPRFYGVNIHPIIPDEAFKHRALIRDLKPDTIRVMTREYVRYYREDGKSRREVRTLSPKRGAFDWKGLDDFLDGIVSVGAEPYVAFGFGAPEWLNSAGKPRLYRPLRDDLPAYADYMAAIARHIAEKGVAVPFVTIDNEPENVGFPLADYTLLHRLASEKIREALPGVKIAGPATGYADWKEPDGRKYGFAGALKHLRDDGVRLDAVDWHIYSGPTERIFRTVDTVRGIFGPDARLFITELNLDWRYSGTGGEESRLRNTGWPSAVWLAAVFDGLQRKKVERVYYFNLQDGFFGLYDYAGTEARPAYHVFRMFTNLLGRTRVAATSGHPAVGVVATRDDAGRMAVLLYNLAGAEVAVRVAGGLFDKPVKAHGLSKEWYEAHRAVVDGRAAEPPAAVVDPATVLTLPARGIVVLRETRYTDFS